ncbi:MAG: hypothetical protein L0207_01810 [Chlamydiae bacterium]|nr:hypothetical protein [Chlamydiota bacterium]
MSVKVPEKSVYDTMYQTVTNVIKEELGEEKLSKTLQDPEFTKIHDLDDIQEKLFQKILLIIATRFKSHTEITKKFKNPEGFGTFQYEILKKIEKVLPRIQQLTGK